jgi:hypothetical protein
METNESDDHNERQIASSRICSAVATVCAAVTEMFLYATGAIEKIWRWERLTFARWQALGDAIILFFCGIASVP